MIGEKTAENLKIEIGTAIEQENEMYAEIRKGSYFRVTKNN